MDTIHPTIFWNWFDRFNNVYKHLHRLSAEDAGFWRKELSSHLQLYCECDWYVDFEQDLTGHDTVMIFTAKRQLRYFDIIDQLVQHAPAIPGWKFHALYPPGQPAYKVVDRFGHSCIEPHELWISPSHTYQVGGGKYFVTIYAELYNPADETHRKIVDAILFNILGERSMVQDLAGFKVSWIYGFDQELRNQLKPLKKLPALFAEMKLQNSLTSPQLERA
jgi:hypothetical protein